MPDKVNSQKRRDLAAKCASLLEVVSINTVFIELFSEHLTDGKEITENMTHAVAFSANAVDAAVGEFLEALEDIGIELF